MSATTTKETYQADLEQATSRLAERGGLSIDWATPETLANLSENIAAAFEATWAEGITVDEWTDRAAARIAW